MQEKNRNIYQTARNAAGLTQETAAEMLAVSVESLRAYELGARLPPNDVVDLMVIGYRSDLVGLLHLRSSGATGRALLPEVEATPLPEAVLRLVNLVFQFADKHCAYQLMQMAEDGVISDEERPIFDEIVLGDLAQIVEAALTLRCTQRCKDKDIPSIHRLQVR